MSTLDTVASGRSRPPLHEKWRSGGAPEHVRGDALRTRLRAVAGWLLTPVGALSIALVVLVVALILTSPYFLTERNITSVLEGVAIDGIIAAFSTLVMIMGGLDISAVGVAVLTSVVSGELIIHGLGVTVAILVSLGVGVVFGAVNGILVTVIGINPFVATLATYFVASGLGFVISGGNASAISDPVFLSLAGAIWFLDVPVLVVVMLASYVVAEFVLRTTRFGLRLYAIGGGAAAAALSGVRVKRIQLSTYFVNSVMAAVAGVLLASWSQAAVPSATSGNDLLLILAAIILGGVGLSGGTGSALGTLLGVCFLGVVDNALTLWQVSNFWQAPVTGAVLIVAVSASALRQRRTPRR